MLEIKGTQDPTGGEFNSRQVWLVFRGCHDYQYQGELEVCVVVTCFCLLKMRFKYIS